MKKLIVAGLAGLAIAGMSACGTSASSDSQPSPAQTHAAKHHHHHAKPHRTKVKHVTLVDVKGTGTKSTSEFTTTGPSTLHYHYSCAGFGQKGNFQVFLEQGSNPVDIPVNELAMHGTDTTQIYETGTFHLEMNSECSWHVKVVQSSSQM